MVVVIVAAAAATSADADARAPCLGGGAFGIHIDSVVVVCRLC